MSQTKEFELSDAYKEKIERSFRVMDTNKDGHLTLKEAESGMKVVGLSDADIYKIKKEMEDSGKETIDYSTYEKIMKPTAQKLFFKQKGIEVIRKEFKKLDIDGNGSIDRDEFKKTLREKGTINEELLEEMFMEADLNGDGKLDFKEFRDWISKIHV